MENKSIFWLCIIFAVSAAAILLVNSFDVIYENYMFRGIATSLAQIAIIAISLFIIKNKILRFALLAWLVAVLLWRVNNLLGILHRPIIGTIFYILFYALIFFVMWKEIDIKKNSKNKNNKQNKQNKTILQIIFFSILMLAVVYFGFIFGKAFAIDYVFGIFDAIIIALAFVLIIQKKPASGYFMLAIADLTLLWQLRGQGYYVASWVEIIFVIAFFILSAEKSRQIK